MSDAPLNSSTQPLLTALLQATAELAELNRKYDQKLDQQNQKLDQHNQQLNQQNQKLDQHNQQLNQQNQKLDHLTEQVGRFTEGLTELKLLVYEQSDTSKRQAEAAERQERNIEKLVGIVDKLIQERS